MITMDEGITPLMLDKAPWLKTSDEPGTGSGQIHLATAKLHIAISLNPYRLEVHDVEGKKICAVGGPEKDNFCNWDSYNTGITRTMSGSPVAVENFDLAYDECIYGLGERFIKLNKVGQTIDLNMIGCAGRHHPARRIKISPSSSARTATASSSTIPA